MSSNRSISKRGWRRITTVGVVVLLVIALSACSSSKKTAVDTIKIGYIAPATGVYAGFTDGDPYMLRIVREQFAKGLVIGGKTYNVQIIAKDSGSDPQKAGQLADELITTNKVDILLATDTPETTNPVIAKCEATATPCITAVAPWQAVYFGSGKTPTDPFKWTHHFFFGLEGFAAVDPNAWDQLKTNKKVGVLWPNDADGQAFRDPTTGYAPIAKSKGYTIVDPGAYEDGTKDFTSIITKFKTAGVDIIAGVPTPPDFVNFWTQAAQQGLKLKAATVGKALFFPATVPSIPNDLGVGLSFAAWWGPTFPYKSSFNGWTPQQFIDAYAASPEGVGKTWNQATPEHYSMFEVVAKALVDSGKAHDKAAFEGAMDKMVIDTLSGHLDWAGGPTNIYKSIATIPTVIGQWEKDSAGKWQWVVVDNKSFPSVPAVRGIKALS